ncbi:hypothetical protein FRC11_003395 [Ceratobasidium sp. 423]|nr:hypothetical protein FRC11_003395 [Ceratobasidium sp. 423]
MDSINLSADGTRLAMTTGDVIYVIDTSTGNSILNPIGRRTWSTAISPDGTLVVFRGNGDTIYLWDTQNGGSATELFPESRFNPCSIEFSPDGFYIAFGTMGGDLYIGSLQSKRLVLGPLKAHPVQVNSLSFSPDGFYLASSSIVDHNVRIWDTRTGQTVGNPFGGDSVGIQSVAYYSDGSRLVSTSMDKTIRVWDPRTGRVVLGPLKWQSDELIAAALSPDGSLIASVSYDRMIQVRDAKSGQLVMDPLEGHTECVGSVVFSPDSTRLFSRADDGTIRVWDVQHPEVPDVPPPVLAPSSQIRSIRYSHSNLRIVSGSSNGTIHIWNVQKGEMLLGPLYGHTDSISSVDYSPNDAFIASASKDKTLRIWDAWNGSDMHGPILGHTDRATCVRFSPDSSLLASGSFDHTLRIWDVTSGQQITLLQITDITSVGFSPNGYQIVSSSQYNTICTLDRQTGERVIGPIQGHRNLCSSAEFSADGLQIIACSYGLIHRWNAQTGQEIPVCDFDFPGDDDSPHFMAFSPDGQYVVSGSNDNKTICVLDAQTGHLVLGPLGGHMEAITIIKFSPDGSHVATYSIDRIIRLWDISSCRANPQASKVNAEDEVAGRNLQATRRPGAWRLDPDGWVVDSEKQRLVWVPSDLHNYLLHPLNDSMISDRGSFKLNFDGANIGELWTGCYRS